MGGKRLVDEASGPLFVHCVMWSRTDTSVLSALPVRYQVGKIFRSTTQKSLFLSASNSQKSVMIKQIFDRLATLLNEFMSALLFNNSSTRARWI